MAKNPRIYLSSTPDDAGCFVGDRDLKKRLTKVLRLQQGDLLEVVAAGMKWECRVVEIQPDGIRLNALEGKPLVWPTSSRLHLVLGQAIPKGDRFDWVIEKATELGIAEIYPLVTERSVVRPSNVPARLQRWNQISEQAAGQSENGFPTAVHPPLSLREFLAVPSPALKLMMHEREGSEALGKLLSALPTNLIIFVVGPEGGWASEETKAMAGAGYHRIHLGDRVFRADTSGLVIASILQYLVGDFRESS